MIVCICSLLGTCHSELSRLLQILRVGRRSHHHLDFTSLCVLVRVDRNINFDLVKYRDGDCLSI